MALTSLAPGFPVLQEIDQPFLVSLLSVEKKSSTMLLVLVMVAGRVEPHLFSIKVVPSPFLIVKES